MTAHDVHPLKWSMLERATTTLRRAFAADPMFEWIFPDPARRETSLQCLNRVPLKYGLRYGHATQSHDGRAAAVWLPPGRKATLAGMIRCGMLRVPFRIGFGPFAQFMGATQVMDRLHNKYVPEPHWYLVIVAVDPEMQGRGCGSALVAEGLARADAMNCPCYLETSEERNVAFYERQGFAVVESAPLGAGGPPGWAMRREARGS